MLIKVCGLRDEQNAQNVAALGVDFVGMIFYPQSPRYILEPISIKGEAKKVGVFVNASIEFIERKAIEFELDLIQLHGDETASYCKELKKLGKPITKAFRVSEEFDFASTDEFEPFSDYFLFDTAGANYGGNGMPFDWGLLQNYTGNIPFFLSGGIGIMNSKELKQFKHPQFIGIDLNSKFEVNPGMKDVKRLESFIEKVRKNESVFS